MTNQCCEILWRGLKTARRKEHTLTEMMPRFIPPIRITPKAANSFSEPDTCVRVEIMSQISLAQFHSDQPSCADLLKDQPSVSELVDHQPGLTELIKNQPTPGDLFRHIELHEQ